MRLEITSSKLVSLKYFGTTFIASINKPQKIYIGSLFRIASN